MVQTLEYNNVQIYTLKWTFKAFNSANQKNICYSSPKHIYFLQKNMKVSGVSSEKINMFILHYSQLALSLLRFY